MTPSLLPSMFQLGGLIGGGVFAWRNLDRATTPGTSWSFSRIMTSLAVHSLLGAAIAVGLGVVLIFNGGEP